MSFFWWEFTCCSECWECLLRKYVNNVFCILSRNVRCDLKNAIQICSLQRLFEWFILVIMLDHFIVSFFWSSSLTFSEWRMLILDYQVMYVCSRSVERRLTKTTHQTWWMKTSSHQIWRKRLIKSDESDSSNLTKATSHQIFEKEDSSSSFWWTILCSDTWCEELSLAEDHFLYEDKRLCEIVVINERSNESWTLIKFNFFLRKEFQVMSR
jgi:hypothetical protein